MANSLSRPEDRYALAKAVKWPDNLLLLARIVHLGDDPQAHERGIGVPPQPLRVLRIASAPRLGGRSPRRRPQLRRLVVPRSAADGVRIQLLAGIVERRVR